MSRTHPTGGTRVTSGFRTKKRPDHDGTDYRTSNSDHPDGIGLPIRAAMSGVVACGTGHNIAGNWVHITDGDTKLGHSHLSKLNVKSGQRVKAGDVIGWSGDTGNARGAHLHFSVRVGRDYVNPVEWLKGGNAPKPKPSKPTASKRTQLVPFTWDDDDVRELQRVLNAWYPFLTPLVRDGDYGTKTTKRVKYLQGRAGLPVTGIADAATLKLLGIKLKH